MEEETKITLRNFSKSEALNGAAIGWAVNGNKEEGLKKSAYGFREGGSGFQYMVDSKTYECNFAGVSIDGDKTKQLFMIDYELDETEGSVGSRGDAGDIIIDSLQPREIIAIEAMKAIIGTMENPLHCNVYTVQQVADKSFQFAQAMMAKSAEKRSTEGYDIEVHESSIVSVTDKILYQMQKSLKEISNNTKEKEESAT